MNEIMNEENKTTRVKAVPKSIEEKLAALEEKAKKRREKERAEISKLKKELEDAKFKAILKNLHENGIDSENQVKAMIKVFDLVKSYNLHDVNGLKKALDAAKEVSPELFPEIEAE